MFLYFWKDFRFYSPRGKANDYDKADQDDASLTCIMVQHLQIILSEHHAGTWKGIVLSMLPPEWHNFNTTLHADTQQDGIHEPWWQLLPRQNTLRHKLLLKGLLSSRKDSHRFYKRPTIKAQKVAVSAILHASATEDSRDTWQTDWTRSSEGLTLAGLILPMDLRMCMSVHLQPLLAIAPHLPRGPSLVMVKPEAGNSH